MLEKDRNEDQLEEILSMKFMRPYAGPQDLTESQTNKM